MLSEGVAELRDTDIFLCNMMLKYPSIVSKAISGEQLIQKHIFQKITMVPLQKKLAVFTILYLQVEFLLMIQSLFQLSSITIVSLKNVTVLEDQHLSKN